MNTSTTRTRTPVGIITLLVAVTLISACGGGGSNSSTNTQTPTFSSPPASAAALSVSYGNVKTLDFNWSDVSDANYYRLLENPDGVSGFTQVGGDVTQGEQMLALSVPLWAKLNAQYILQTCNNMGCVDSSVLAINDGIADSIGYFKASNTDASDNFGFSVDLSGDGNTLAVGAPFEASNASGIGGDQNDDSAGSSGAVYVYARVAGNWQQQAYIKASNAQSGDAFGWSVTLSDDGNTLAVGSEDESSNATGVNGDQANNMSSDSGAVYVFARNANSWSQQAYLKAGNTGANDNFGHDIALSGDGNTLIVGAPWESGASTTINGPYNNDAVIAGAAYVFVRSGSNWSQQAYLKAPNADIGDLFGEAVAINGDGNRVAVGAIGEASNASGVNGDQNDDSLDDAGAVYLFTRSGSSWSFEAYIKAGNTGNLDRFSTGLSLSHDGDTLAVGAREEDSNATGVDGDGNNNLSATSGAVYVYARSGSVWSQQAYIKSTNTEGGDVFGGRDFGNGGVSLSADGNLLAVGAIGEDSQSTAFNGNQADNNESGSGAVYLYRRSSGIWSPLSYLKATNTHLQDVFGYDLALDNAGNSLAISARNESSAATGINGDDSDVSAPLAGAVFLF